MTTSGSSVDASLSNQIYLSRDNIRSQIINYIQYYLEIENVDLVKSSFLTFLVDTIATLTSNLLFYSSSCYKEFFLTKAMLPESIYNLSAFLGYNPNEATYAIADLLVTIPFGFESDDVTIVFSTNEKPFITKTSSDIEFRTYYETTIHVQQSVPAVSIKVIEGLDKSYDLPVIIDTTSSEQSFSFLLPFRQYKEITQEFSVDSDTELYQFVTIDVPLSGKVSSLDVKVILEDGTTEQQYYEFPSVYLMSSTDEGYVSRSISNGRRLVFGNGLIGKQPAPGSTVIVTANITEGADGNVIAGSIKNGSRLYTKGDGKVVNYTIVNASPANGGTDEESIQEIRSNAIANLVMLNRLVSEYDYQHAGVIMPNTPIAQNTIPVLKRSDIKCNEIQLYTVLEYGSNERTDADTGEIITQATVVPTRNVFYTVPFSQTHINRGTEITLSPYTYLTLFDIDVDLINAAAYYTYIMTKVEIVPILDTSYLEAPYNMVCTKVSAEKVEVEDEGEIIEAALISLSYTSTESDYYNCSASMVIPKTSFCEKMDHDSINKTFSYTFKPYTEFPEGNIELEFTVKRADNSPIVKYMAEITFIKSLDDFMMSNVSIDSTAQTSIIYDIPVVEKEYYNSIVQKDFELTVLQKMMDVMEFKNYRMLTDFTNLKFTNTIGTMTNMKYNPVTKPDCLEINLLEPPSAPEIGDRYIIGFTDDPTWNDRYGQIAQWTAEGWYYFLPITDDIIYVFGQNKKYIYNGNKWVLMEYSCPLEISVEVFRDPQYYNSDITLSNRVKSILLNEYSSRFGPNITLYKSEIIKTIQSIEGVGHCNLIKPESNIFFEYDLNSGFTEQELLEYSPEYIYFTEDSIFVKVYS